MNKLIPYILVGIGGFFGAIARFLIAQIFSRSYTTYFPFHTFFTNIIGCFFIGILSFIAVHVKVVDPDYVRYILSIGFVGAFTTFSTFELETYTLFYDNAYILALLYILLSVLLGFIAVKLGISFGKILANII